jgi:hypothetical protein
MDTEAYAVLFARTWSPMRLVFSMRWLGVLKACVHAASAE